MQFNITKPINTLHTMPKTVEIRAVMLKSISLDINFLALI